MAHVRKQVRDAYVELIKGTALCGVRVQATRFKPVARNASSCAYVYTTSEPVETLDTDNTQLRRLRVRIDAFVKGDADDLQDQLDAFATEVETKVAADARLGGLLATECELKQTDFNANFDAEKPFSVISIIYEAAILTMAGSPETAL